MMFVPSVLAVLLAYLLGSIPTGTIVARVYRNVDITRVGSQRTGATNVLRTLGPGAAAVVFLGDALKGAIAVLAAQTLAPNDAWVVSLAALAAMAGHNFSVFIRFRGGRGVTTGLGALLCIAPWAALGAVILGSVLIATTKYVSLGSMTGAAAGGLIVAGMALAGLLPGPYFWFGLTAAIFIVTSHRDNLARLAKGSERRLGERAEPG